MAGSQAVCEALLARCQPNSRAAELLSSGLAFLNQQKDGSPSLLGQQVRCSAHLIMHTSNGDALHPVAALAEHHTSLHTLICCVTHHAMLVCLQDQPCTEEVWAPCIVWLINSIPGLLSSTHAQDAATAPPATARVPLSELLDACGIRCVRTYVQ